MNASELSSVYTQRVQRQDRTEKKYRLKIQTLPKIITHASPNMSIIPASAENILKIVNYLFEK